MNYYTVILMLIPVIVVFFAIYLLFRQFFQNQYKLQLNLNRQTLNDSVSKVRLQAYERLMLYCERISVQNLLLRIQTSKMTSQDLRSSLVMAVQQEFEHNLSQQLYVSKQLWQIVELAKNQVIEIVIHVSADVKPDAPAEELSAQLILFIESQKHNPVETAKEAIRQESGLLL